MLKVFERGQTALSFASLHLYFAAFQHPMLVQHLKNSTAAAAATAVAVDADSDADVDIGNGIVASCCCCCCCCIAALVMDYTETGFGPAADAAAADVADVWMDTAAGEGIG